MPDRPALWRHLLAMVYDTFLVAPLLMANAFVLVTVFGPTASATEPAVPSWLMQITSLMVIFAFFIPFFGAKVARHWACRPGVSNWWMNRVNRWGFVRA